MTQLPLNDAIPRFKANEERIDVFANANNSTSYVTSGNVSVPSVAKFLLETSNTINVFLTAQTTLIITSANNAVNAAISANNSRVSAQTAQAAAEVARDQTLAVAYNASDFATFAQGAKADTALQPNNVGTIAIQNSNNITITGGSITGIVDLAVVDGGTGSSNATGARTNLGIGTIGTQNANSVTISGGTISGITDLAIADGGTGASDASGARSNLGVGTIGTQNSNNVTITGGTVTGITDLTIADGGTGASTAAAARTNLGLGNSAVLDTTYFASNADLQTAKSDLTLTAQNLAIAFAIALG